MNALPSLRRRPPAPLEQHALEEIRFIRDTMERATSWTAFPGWGLVVIGVTAATVAALAARAPSSAAWIQTWLAEAVLAVGVGTAAMAFKARRMGSAPFSPGWRRFALSFSLALAAGLVLTVALARAHETDLLPGLWMLLYGVGIRTAGAFSVAPVRVMGYAFMLTGIVALFTPPGWRDALMAVSFGALHVGFGAWIARRHGG